MEGRTWPLRLERAGPGEQGGGTSGIRSFLVVGNIVSRFYLDVVFFHHVSGF